MMKKNVSNKTSGAAKKTAASSANKPKPSALADYFRGTKKFDGTFFESVFAHRTMVDDFMTMFQRAITEADTVLLTKVNKCFEAQYARLPHCYGSQAPPYPKMTQIYS